MTPGPLTRIAGTVYSALVLEALTLLASAPGFVLIAFLVADPSNVPLVALGLIPVGPALSAAVFAWDAGRRTSDLVPAREFLRGYRLNAGLVLRWWVPLLLLGTVVAVNLTDLDAVVPAGPARTALAIALAVVALAVVVVSAHALVISSLFAFRARDVLVLAARQAIARPRVTVGVLAYAVIALGIVVLTAEGVLALLLSVLAALLLQNARAVVRQIEENHIA